MATGSMKSKQEKRRSSLSDDELIIFVLGGPGSGKGTQCKMIAQRDDQFCHLSVGDLLRLEQESGSKHGTMIKNYIKEAKLVPSEIVVDLILQAMKRSGKKKFLIDGFPRNEENRVEFYSACQLKPKFVLYLSCSKEVMVQRLLCRQQRDDNIETIRKRLKVFENSSLPVIEYYRSGNTSRAELEKILFLRGKAMELELDQPDYGE
ncbi:hypothetical protein C5167_012517 [Papaver somniferum]|uniref:adenylate kinase n=1 Tax=Papaver somniferum TaxID=3469 RepID=A0A4Y7J0S7_PAPSO|nr:hypothetical protein C5167_012517 [Papaver somniferum]